MIYTEMTVKAMKISYQAHHGQEDSAGVPYIFHPIHLAEQMPDECTTCIALLHDVVEDTSVTMDELTFPDEVTDALKLLTHVGDYDYEDYIAYVKEIAQNRNAAIVKIADVKHNMDESRLAGSSTSEEQREWWRKKYSAALKILKEKVE